MMRNSSTRKPLYGIVALVLFTYLPFVNQPFHIDDNLYIDVAKNVFHRPWFAQDFPYVFEGEAIRDMASHSHPPFTSYFIAGLMWLSGPRAHPSEVILHLGYLIFPLLLGVSAFFLARRFTADPALATALLMATPVVVTMSHFMSPDIITLSLWVAGVTAFIYGLDKGRAGLLILSALAAGLAVFTSYQAVSVAGLFLLYAALQKKWDRRAWLVSSVPVLVVIGWLLLGYWHYERFLFTHTFRFGVDRGGWAWSRQTDTLLSVLISLGGVTAFPLLILALFSGWVRGRVVALMGLISVGLVALSSPRYPLWEKVMLVGYLTSGLVFFARIMARGVMDAVSWRERAFKITAATATARDRLFLSLWVLGVFAYCNGLFFTFAARYMLPMVPPALLILVNEAGARRRYPRRLLIAGTVATLALAFVYSVADYQFARIYPQVASHLQDTYIKAGWKTWCAGEWGFRYYGGVVGCETLVTERSALKGGDLVAVPELASGYAAAQDIEALLIPVDRRAYQPDHPLRLLDRFSHAGFHGVYCGLLPISLSRQPLEEVAIKQVSVLAEWLPAAQFSGGGADAVPYTTLWALAGEPKLTLKQMPGSGLTYRWKIPANAQATFSLGVMNPSQLPDGSLTFSLWVKGPNGEAQSIFSRPVPVTRGHAPHWIPEAVSLAAYSHQTVDLTLQLTANVADGALLQGGWGDFLIVPSGHPGR